MLFSFKNWKKKSDQYFFPAFTSFISKNYWWKLLTFLAWSYCFPKETAQSIWAKVNVSLINQSMLHLSLLYFRVFSSSKLTLGVSSYKLFTVHHKNNNSHYPYRVWQSERWPRTWRVSDPEQNNVPQVPPRVNMASCDHTGAQTQSVPRLQQSANK